MKYWIITDSYAAPTCDLTDKQFERFRDLSCNNIPGEFNAREEQMHGQGENRMVLCVEYRSDWEKSDTETTHENTTYGSDLPFCTAYAKIIPASIIDKDAPHEFTIKKSAYKIRPNTMRQGTTFIEQFLQLAEEIKRNDQIAENNSYPLDAIREADSIKPTDIRVTEHAEKALDQQNAMIENLMVVVEKIVTAVKENTAKRQNDVFQGTFRARARFSEPDDEVEIEKIHRLKQDGWKWENIVLQVYPDSENLSSEDFKKKVEAVKQQYHREYGQSESKKSGWPVV